MLVIRPVLLLIRSGLQGAVGATYGALMFLGYWVILGATTVGRPVVSKARRRASWIIAAPCCAATASYFAYKLTINRRQQKPKLVEELQGTGQVVEHESGDVTPVCTVGKRLVHIEPTPYGPWILKFYVQLVPRKIQSRLFGYINSFTLPIFLREPLIGLFSRYYQCDLSEALQPDLRAYSNLSEFFRRTLRPELRPVALNTDLVSPADGRIDVFGEVIGNTIEQVKGINYDVSAFVGQDLAHKYSPSSDDMRRYYCVIYLSPGDYHGFHSPTDWRVNFRRHFTGHLLGVSETVTRKVANLFCLNERVMLGGRWKHGFFTMTAVGATNVGNIALEHEQALSTNKRGRRFSHVDDLVYVDSVSKNRGEKVGEFRFGSSIVLFFEAPKNFHFTVSLGQKIKYGQSLGDVIDCEQNQRSVGALEN